MERKVILLRPQVVAFALLGFTAMLLLSCGLPSAPVESPMVSAAILCSSSGPVANPLSAADVQLVVQNAAQSINAAVVIAVTDRVGNVLAVYDKTGAPATAVGNFGTTYDADDIAVALARTASFFSNSQAPISSRTVRFISGVHFPPGIDNTPNAALYGIENTNRGCSLNADFAPGQSVPPANSLSGGVGLGPLTGKFDLNDDEVDGSVPVNPGGVPLFVNGQLAGGVGVAGTSRDVNSGATEFAAFSGACNSGFLPILPYCSTGSEPPPPGIVVIDGISLPLVNQTAMPAGYKAGIFSGSYTHGTASNASPSPEGCLVSPVAGASVSGQNLTQSDVSQIIANAINTASVTRAVLRLPSGSRARMSIAVAGPDGALLGLYRMADGTVFSLDVAVGKARNVVWFSSPPGLAADLPGVPSLASPGTAVTNRTIGFGAQPFFPPGINGSGPGPFFGLYQYDTAHACTQGHDPLNTQNQNGLVFFPGSAPLFKNGVLVGGLGVSGDGVDQDDYVTAGGAGFLGASPAFLPAASDRADQVVIDSVRLPYWKFPRNPTD